MGRRKNVSTRPVILFLSAIVLAPLSGARAQDAAEPSPAAREAIEAERTRSAIEAVFEDLQSPKPRMHLGDAFERLASLGPAVIPFLEAEFDAPGTPWWPVACHVLGHIEGSASEAALRRAIDKADRDETGLAVKRKLWAAYGLAIHGSPDAIDLIDTGRIRAGRAELMDHLSGLEAIALLTAPASIPRIADTLKALSASRDNDLRMAALLAALRWTRHPSALAAATPWLDHPSPRVREAAIRAAGASGVPSALEHVTRSLSDPDPDVRLGAALALEDLAPRDSLRLVLSRLEVETAPFVRASLYRRLAAIGGDESLNALAAQWGRPDDLDRLALMDAVGATGNRKALNLARAGLRDRDTAVVLHAAAAVEILGGPGAADTFLALLGDPRPGVVQAAAGALARLGDPRAGPRIADILLRRYFSGPLPEIGMISEIPPLAEALVRLNHSEPLQALQASTSKIVDGTVRQTADQLISRLKVLAANGSDRAKWTASAASSDRDQRLLAYRRLGEIGGAEGAQALVAAFGRAEPDDMEPIMLALARSRTAVAEPLIERLLVDDAFDAYAKKRVRAAAAWAARRIGGTRMIEALRRSAVRRDGQDFAVLHYLAVASGREALPLLAQLRPARFRHFEISRAEEQFALDRLERDIAAGKPVTWADDEPTRITPD